MKPQELVRQLERALEPELFAETMKAFHKLNNERQTAIARCNHYVIGFEAMASHDCEAATGYVGWVYRTTGDLVAGRPLGEFVCVGCGAKA